MFNYPMRVSKEYANSLIELKDVDKLIIFYEHPDQLTDIIYAMMDIGFYDTEKNISFICVNDLELETYSEQSDSTDHYYEILKNAIRMNFWDFIEEIANSHSYTTLIFGRNNCDNISHISIVKSTFSDFQRNFMTVEHN